MAVSKAKKIEQVEELGNELKSVPHVIVATFGKLTVAQDFELRKALRASGARYRVVKNTLAERAAKGSKVEEILKNLEGRTSIAYTQYECCRPRLGHCRGSRRGEAEVQRGLIPGSTEPYEISKTDNSKAEK